MIISKAYIEQFVSYLDTVNEAAGKTIIYETKKRRLMERLAENPDITRHDFALLMNEVCRTYTKLASALTCEFYNGIRNGAKLPTKFNATLWDGYSEQAVVAATNAIIDEVTGGRATVPLVNLLSDLSARFNKRASDGTIRQNVMKDPARPRYAIVPNGDACAFCVMRASNTYYSEPQPESHDHCKCVATPLFGAKIEGFDQKSYENKWNEAAEAYRNGEISEDMKLRIANAKAEHGERFVEGETNVKWNDTNAILMVMREQQGIK